MLFSLSLSLTNIKKLQFISKAVSPLSVYSYTDSYYTCSFALI